MANNKGYNIDWTKRVVTMTKKFADEANEYGTPAYKTVNGFRKDGFQITVRKTEKRKACPTRVTFKQMEQLLSCMTKLSFNGVFNPISSLPRSRLKGPGWSSDRKEKVRHFFRPYKLSLHYFFL